MWQDNGKSTPVGRITFESLTGKKQKKISKTKALAFCAVLASLGVIILYLGAIIEVLDLSMAAIASLLSALTLIEIGGAYPYLVYLVTSALSLLLLPQKFGAIIYALIAGYYPILKIKLDSSNMSRFLKIIIKLAVFNAAMGISAYLSAYLITGGAVISKSYYISLFAVGNFTFIIFDYALTMLFRLYFLKYRKLLGIDRFLK